MCLDFRGSIITSYVTMSASYGIPVSKNFRKFSKMFTLTNVDGLEVCNWLWIEFLQHIA